MSSLESRKTSLNRLLDSERPKSSLEIHAIQRQLNDLQHAHERGLIWDEEKAIDAVRFFGLLHHWKGDLAGQSIVLEQWQEQCIVAPLFGWWKVDSSGRRKRRFNTGYCEIPRKNGKSTLAGGIGLKGLVADGEYGAEVYAAATKRDQACILFHDAQQFVRKSPELQQRLTNFKFSIVCEHLSSKFQPLSSDHDSMDGLNIHMAMVDELHAHKTRELWDVLLTATGARRNPLQLAITTAGSDRTSICWEQHEYARKILESEDPGYDDSYFSFIACAEPEDDWADENTWWKANPNLDIAITRDNLRNVFKQAQESKAAENNFRRKHLDQWVTRFTKGIDVEQWRKCRGEIPDLVGRDCFIGVDLGFRDDFAAMVAVFPEMEHLAANPDTGETAKNRVKQAVVLCYLWLPREGKRDVQRAPLCNWVAKDRVFVTPGPTTDIGAIFRKVLELRQKYNVRDVRFDPNNARQFGQDLLAEGVPATEFYQTKRNYNECCIELNTLIANKRILHDGNETLEWMVDNAVFESDAIGQVMPSKVKSGEKIDGLVAMLMGLAGALFTPPQVVHTFYETNDLEMC